ncbi:MAG: L-threonine 3-dehydrogenase [Armatimonadetes bacterium]|nr:L-threonine 3-dehydrogenase [Armatimonadota bacterium]
MKAIAKTRPAPGVEIIEVDEPRIQPGMVKVKLKAASVCGTDLHIYSWDAWSASRIQPPRIIGHEFCGEIVEVGSGVNRQVGEYISSESHVVCGRCRQCLNGQGHVCVNTRILGVDIDGGFAPYVVIPADNAVPANPAIPPRIAAFQDALGNAVHTATAGPVEGQTILITGLGPIGLFAATVCRALGAKKIAGTEVSPYRLNIAAQMGMDAVFDMREKDADKRIYEFMPEGFDGTLEMSGHPSAISLAIRNTRPGGRISLLGIFPENIQPVDINQAIFKGLDLQGIVGRNLWKTWKEMAKLHESGKLNLDPVITHEMHYTEFQTAMELMKAGQAGKVVFHFDD